MYLHDDTSHNVLEGLLELCKAVISRVKFKIEHKCCFQLFKVSQLLIHLAKQDSTTPFVH